MKALTNETAKAAYQKMNTIRDFEEHVRKIFAAGVIPGFVHLYAGEEAIAVAACAHLNQQDYITSTHRGHGHCIAKGCDVNGMMAEIYGKTTGLCKGKGGSMHIADLDQGMLGANGMVGGGFPIAIGAALRQQYLKTDRVVICFFGDGAANEGAFHESLNMAAIWKLPVVFVNENNGFGEATSPKYASASKTFASRAAAYDMPGEKVDGKDFMAVYNAVGQAVDRARAGEGPSLIECQTYRTYGHFEGDEQTYKFDSPEEIAFAKRDDIQEFRAYALKANLFTEAEATAVEDQAMAAVQAAVQFAEDSPLPDAQALYEDVYAD